MTNIRGEVGTQQRVWPKSFADRLTHELPKPRQILQVFREGGFRGVAAEADRIPVLRNGLPPVDADTTALTWIGHASYLIRMAGATVLADPVWSKRISRVSVRLTPPGLAWSELPTVDAVTISHNHYDHLDAPTIERLPRSTPMLVPAGLGNWFRRRRFSTVLECDWWESVELGDLTFTFVPAHHWSRRTPFDTCRSLWGGWVITGPNGERVHHTGDSGYGDHFRAIGERFAPIDVTMMPTGAYEPRWFMRPVHMTPEEAVRAAADLGAARLAHMHWGTFVLTKEPVIEPLLRLRKAWAEAGLDPANLWDLAIGETRSTNR